MAEHTIDISNVAPAVPDDVLIHIASQLHAGLHALHANLPTELQTAPPDRAAAITYLQYYSREFNNLRARIQAHQQTRERLNRMRGTLRSTGVFDNTYTDQYKIDLPEVPAPTPATPNRTPAPQPGGGGNAGGQQNAAGGQGGHEKENIIAHWEKHGNWFQRNILAKILPIGAAGAAVGVPTVLTGGTAVVQNALTWGPVVSVLKGLGLSTVFGLPLAPIIGGLSIPLGILPIISKIRDEFIGGRDEKNAKERGYFERVWHGLGTVVGAPLLPFTYFGKKFARNAGKASGHVLKSVEESTTNVIKGGAEIAGKIIKAPAIPFKKKNMLAAALGGILGFFGLGGPAGAAIGAFAGAGVKELADHTEGKESAVGHGTDHKKDHSKHDDAEEKAAH